MNMNLKVTTARPEDNALSIQCRQPLSRTNTGSPRMSISPLDNSCPPSEIDYAEHVAANCNIDIEVTNPSLPLADDTMSFNFSLPPFNPHVSLEEALNSVPISKTDISTEPFPPSVIRIVLMSQLTLAYGTATSWSHLFSVQTNFSIVTSTTSCILFNT